MRNRSHRFNKSLCLLAMVMLVLLVSSCSHRDNSVQHSRTDDNNLRITPELMKVLENYNVEGIRDGYLVVSEYDPAKDNYDNKYKRYGCMNMQGKLILPTRYTTLSPVGGDLLRAQYIEKAHGLKWALINKKGKEITGYVYDELIPIGKLSNNYFKAKKDDKYGIIDRRGKTVVPFQYDEIHDFYSGYACFSGFSFKDYSGFRDFKEYRYYSKEYDLDDAVYLVKDRDGVVLNLTEKDNPKRPRHDDSPFDYQRIKRNGKYGYVNCYGEEIPCQYQDAAKLFSEGLAAVVQNNKVGYIDKKGNLVIPFQFDYSASDLVNENIYLATADIFSEGYACVKKGGKYGFIDKQGNTVIPFIYDWPGAFHDGAAAVMKKTGGKELFGLIDKKNNIILPFEFDYGHYQEKVYVMKEREDPKGFSLKDGIYSTQGKCLSPCQYDGNAFALVFNPQGYSDARKNEKFGVVDNKGQELIPCVYDLCCINYYFNESSKYTMAGTVMVKLNEKWGVVDMQNNVVVPIEFDHISPSGYKELFIVSNGGSRKCLYDISGNSILN